MRRKTSFYDQENVVFFVTIHEYGIGQCLFGPLDKVKMYIFVIY